MPIHREWASLGFFIPTQMTNKYFTTPKGVASYPKLIKPDTKFNPEGTYSVALVIPADEADDLISQIEEIFVEEFGPKKLSELQTPYKKDENGDYIFKFKSSNRPQLFDAAGTAINPKAELKLGSGSVLKVKGSIKPIMVQKKYYATLYINAVQVIDLVEFGGAGFAAEEGSYKADNDNIGDDAQDEPKDSGDAPKAQDF